MASAEAVDVKDRLGVGVTCVLDGVRVPDADLVADVVMVGVSDTLGLPDVVGVCEALGVMVGLGVGLPLGLVLGVEEGEAEGVTDSAGVLLGLGPTMTTMSASFVEAPASSSRLACEGSPSMYRSTLSRDGGGA